MSGEQPTTDGASLQALIDSPRRLDELSTARAIGEAADAVHKAQKTGQALGNLSPDAIRVLASGDIQLAATPAAVSYSAPERIKGGAGDRRSDVFSLGVILWEALAHARLFEGASDEAIKTAVLGAEIRPPSEMNANVPAELDAICKKALSREPADRYQSAKVMAAEIGAVLDDAGYPESNDEIAKFLASQPELLHAAPPKTKVSTQTILGMTAPVFAPTPTPTPAPAPAAAPVILEAPPVVAASAPTPEPAPAPAPAPAIAAAPSLAQMTDPKATLPSGAVVPKLNDGKPNKAKGKKSGPHKAKGGANNAAASTTPPPNDAPRAKSPSGSPLPSWATGRPAGTDPPPSVLSKPPAEIVPDAPASTALGVMLASTPEPVAPTALPAAVSTQTAILGSGAATPSLPPAVSNKTAVLGSNSLLDQLPPLPPGATPMPGDPVLPPAYAGVPAIKPSIASAETVPTPALAAHAAADAAAAAASEAVTRPVSPSDVTLMPAAGMRPGSESDFAEERSSSSGSAPHPAAVVALPRAKSRGDVTKGDVLAGWGWSTDSIEAIDDEDGFYDNRSSSKKRFVVAIVGALGALALIGVVAFAMSSDPKKKDQLAAKKPSPTEQVVTDPPPPLDPPPVEPPVPAEPEVDTTTPAPSEPVLAGEPVPSEPPKEPAKAEPPPEPAKTEPPKVEPPKVEPPKVEPPKVAAEPPKPEPPKAEPPKAEPPKKEPPKTPPKVVAKRPPRQPPPPPPPPTTARPVDPYANDARKVDVNVAYKTGIQQFARGDSNGALTTFKASLASNPNFAPTWRGIGLVYEKLGKKSQAKTAFRRYLQLSPAAGDADQIRDRLERLGS